MNGRHQAPWECLYPGDEETFCISGKEPASDQEYFELLCLCVLQVGINWGTIRRYWNQYKEGFYNFDIQKLSKVEIDKLQEHPRAVKNLKKMQALIQNAQIFNALILEYHNFPNFIKSLKSLSDRKAIQLLASKFKGVGVYTAEYYLHSVGYWIES